MLGLTAQLIRLLFKLAAQTLYFLIQVLSLGPSKVYPGTDAYKLTIVFEAA